eukprot:CAMPEP_0118686002 /NCGR_PEP_ID=MMETSP0800-20121206/7569_1 /TAXON_ID=210618 ORGANISM="Striatella unipunctata, Strain CCMP2910" /NCGR_SAMPLE_ID=MMETSP0800 /ASSEMBLY_ACC=CAM_ASM_000638 /LENGTH=252 /DNA_ID=CAMNT_0006582995 /DNA_START=129 /DNA_END=887 /DNA_ORIENTATION=-
MTRPKRKNKAATAVTASHLQNCSYCSSRSRVFNEEEKPPLQQAKILLAHFYLVAQTTQLELAVWKMACISNPPPNMVFRGYLEWTQWSRDGWKELKPRMCNTSSVLIILTNVVPFLEKEKLPSEQDKEEEEEEEGNIHYEIHIDDDDEDEDEDEDNDINASDDDEDEDDDGDIEIDHWIDNDEQEDDDDDDEQEDDDNENDDGPNLASIIRLMRQNGHLDPERLWEPGYLRERLRFDNMQSILEQHRRRLTR